MPGIEDELIRGQAARMCSITMHAKMPLSLRTEAHAWGKRNSEVVATSEVGLQPLHG